ncbi:MAG: tRNA pseudouridine(55) synthase TruB [Gammaproteobacteria bacterium]|nr:tRNA pseudouridine(55) synthase TruB [Gammaproteobacteria bacterium]
MARKKKGRLVNGILVLDKPTGISSNKALQTVKHLFNAQKAGHTGSLDPLATGVLPICLGESTKVSHYLLDDDKSYRAKCILGSITTTGDTDGELIGEMPVPQLTQEELLELISGFVGSQKQTPPMFSALKHNGRPLYEYARKGIEIERKSRPITIFSIELLDYCLENKASESSFLEIEVKCSKGTYIRTLCEDIGKKIGCGAHISALRRIDSGPFSLSQSITLDELTQNYHINLPDDASSEERMNPELYKKIDQLLLNTDTAIQSFPAIEINTQELDKIQHGICINFPPANLEIKDETKAMQQDYRLYHEHKLICIAILDENKQLKPKRLLFL